jgi:2'-5' RNA ligase
MASAAAGSTCRRFVDAEHLHVTVASSGAHTNERVARSEEAAEGVHAFVEKREPAWRNPG